MSEQDRWLEQERRLRRAAIVATSRQPPEAPAERDEPVPEESEDDSAALRLEQKALWVDLHVRRAIERGEFDNLPGTGKPIDGLGNSHDPDWWVKQKIEREQLTGLLPPALALRKEHTELDAKLDRETTEAGVRRVVEDFNGRVVEARRQLLGGPPVVTPTRDPDQEVAAWHARRTERRERQRRQLEAMTATGGTPARPRWWSHRWPRRSRRRGAG